MHPFYKKKLIIASASLLALGAVVFLPMLNQADAKDDTDPGKAARCATRLSIAILGKAPSADLMSNADPQTSVDAMLATPEFEERFASFINSQFNDGPGATSEADASYHLAKYILTNKKPWKELFNGPYMVNATGGANNRVVAVANDANGLGYFRSKAWLDRYAGNELAGIKLVTAYRLMQNTIGLSLVATSNAPGADVSAKGRQGPACAECHFNKWYGLDNIASVLTKVRRNGQQITYTPADAAGKMIGGLQIKDDKELVNAMLNSENYIFHSCELAFKYLYGRRQSSCENTAMEACKKAMTSSGMIQNALAAFAKDPTYCQ